MRTIAAIFLTFGVASLGSGQNLNLSITSDRGHVGSDEPVTWSILLTNSSSLTETGVQLRVTLPGRVENDINGAVSDYFFNPDPTPEYYSNWEGGQVVTYEVGTLPPGESRMYDVTTFPTYNTPTGYQFIMSAQADSDNGDSFAYTQKTATLQNTLTELALGGDAIRLVKGSSTTLTASFIHDSQVELTDATVEMELPPEVTISAGSSGWKLVGNVVSWDLGDLKKGDNGWRYCTFLYKGNNPAGTLAPTRAKLKSLGTTKNECEWPMAVALIRGLKLNVTSAAKQVAGYNNLTWLVELSNPLNYYVTGGVLRVTTAEGMENGNAGGIQEQYFNPDPDPESSTAYESGEVVYYELGALAPGAKRVFQVTVAPASSFWELRQFILSAQVEAENSVPAAARGVVNRGKFIPATPDIGLEMPPGLTITDNQTTSVKFGTKKLNTSSSKPIKISNTGKGTLAVVKVKITGRDSGDWRIDGLNSNSLGPGDYTTARVIFKPKRIGPRSATVKIISNDPNENPFEIKVSGTGSK